MYSIKTVHHITAHLEERLARPNSVSGCMCKINVTKNGTFSVSVFFFASSMSLQDERGSFQADDILIVSLFFFSICFSSILSCSSLEQHNI